MSSELERAFRDLSVCSIALGEGEFSTSQKASGWIGLAPATLQDVQRCEARLGCPLPPDYRALMLITNGFCAPNGVEPSFLPLDEVGWLAELDPDPYRCL